MYRKLDWSEQAEMRMPPLVAGLPLVGNALSLYRNPLRFLRSAYERYGDVFAIKLGSHTTVLAGAQANRFVAEAGKNCFSSGPVWREAMQEMQCPHSFIGPMAARTHTSAT